MRIAIPPEIEQVLKQLEEAGYEAYAVGGCVRDSLLGRTPHDWDVCTSALPEETKAVFSDRKTIDTGLKHGTCTVLLDGEPIEITTFRIDGAYSDGRHPDQVTFSRNLEEDLARRDFTVNAMAVSRDGRLADPFGGRADLRADIIRAVGDPVKRFQEDGLRVLRALRFASVLGFRIEEGTAGAVRRMAPASGRVSKERILTELSKLLLGESASAVLLAYRDCLPDCLGLPSFAPAAPRLRAVSAAPYDLPVRYALLFGTDAGKQLRALRADNHLIHAAKNASALAGSGRLKDVFCPEGQTAVEDAAVKRLLRDAGEDTVLRAVQIRGALAGATKNADGARCWRSAEQIVRRVVSDPEACWKRSQLTVNGSDLIRAGVPKGPETGRVLTRLLDDVIGGAVPNERAALLKHVPEIRAMVDSPVHEK